MYHINPFITIVDIENILLVKDIMLEDNYFPPSIFRKTLW